MVHTDKVAMTTSLSGKAFNKMSRQSMRAKFPGKHSAWTGLDSPRTQMPLTNSSRVQTLIFESLETLGKTFGRAGFIAF